MRNPRMLKQDQDDSDYTLTGPSVWITVGTISVHIILTDEDVAVDLYPLGAELRQPLASTYAYFQEADDALAEEGKP